MDNVNVLANLDRTGTTPRAAMTIITPALQAAGIDINEITLSTSSIYRARKAMRPIISENIKLSFNPNTPLIAHFDSKILPDADGCNYDRLPIIVSGKGIEKLLAIPKLPEGTGNEMGKAVVAALKEWKNVDQCLALF